MVRFSKIAALLLCAALSGCRSAYVQSTIVNHSGAPVRLVEVDYPSASFGTQEIEEGATFNYRFKVQGDGPVTIAYTGPDNKTHDSSGPTLAEGQRGTLTIILTSDGKVIWTPELAASK